MRRMRHRKTLETAQESEEKPLRAMHTPDTSTADTDTGSEKGGLDVFLCWWLQVVLGRTSSDEREMIESNLTRLSISKNEVHGDSGMPSLKVS